MRIAIAQINPTVGDLGGNAEKIIEYIDKAREKGANLVVFPELAITGYPPKDLLLKPSFIRENREKLEEIVEKSEGIAAVVGFVDGEVEIHNAAALIKDGKVVGVQHKTHLPNYDVFDEKRYFTPAKTCQVFEIYGMKIGVNICEDIWVEEGPPRIQSRLGAGLIVTINASPFHAGKLKEREELIARRAKENFVPMVYCNLVGGQDDLVFDGGSYLFDREGRLIARCKRFEEDLLVRDLEEEPQVIPEEDPMEEVYRALVLGIRDYVRKNGFKKVVIGLSGGIDSSLTALLAVKALGPKNVVGVSMPSRITSQESKDDAAKVAENLGIELKMVPIARAVEAYSETLAKEFEGMEEDVTEENIQARIRGNILMALSNKFGYLVLSTGNKSEMAVGYTTLYGDMAGGLAAISDVPKTMVYQLAEYLNKKEGREVIPKRVLQKEPSAELRIGQRDIDALPPYEVLDPILHAYIEENRSKEEIVAMGFDEKVVEEVVWKVDHNEYKRQQAPPGIKITTKAFGSGRRMPITNKYGG
jgi:NAD+ synthase (glutamine-hydrolysing)